MLPRWFALSAFLAVTFTGIFATSRGAQDTTLPEVRYPKFDQGLDTLPARKQAQLDSASQFKVFYQFHFTDQLKQSGITFRHHAVPYAREQYMRVHYDHGSGIAVADVTGDGLYDIYFVNQLGGNELWKNVGNGKFKNITEDAGVAVKDRVSVGAAFGDVDNTGHEDLFVTTVNQGNILFQNDGHGHFKDITHEAGLDLTAHSSGAFFFDYDNDGLPDLLVCNVGVYTSNEKGPDGEYVGLKDAFFGHLYPERYEHPVLYKNLGHYKFKDVTAEVGLDPHGWCGDATFADLKGDGFPGVYFLNMQGANHYFENEGGKKFVEKTHEYFPKTSWGVSVGDINADGWEDIFVAAGMNYPFRYGINSMLLNNRGEKFLDSEFLLGIEPRQAPYTPWFAMDCSNPGILADRGKEICEGQTGKIMVSVPKASRSSVIFDLDNDGDLDIVTNDFNSEPQILVSDLARQKKIHWLKVILVGTKSNRNGLGATVRLTANGQTCTRYNDGKSGYLSQSVLPLYFGLGDATKIDRIEVDWPSGRKQLLTKGLRENETLKITEPAQ
jgi:hypothetical protein